MLQLITRRLPRVERDTRFITGPGPGVWALQETYWTEREARAAARRMVVRCADMACHIRPIAGASSFELWAYRMTPAEILSGTPTPPVLPATEASA